MPPSLDLAKCIIKAVHEDFAEKGRDNAIHIPLVRRIILATQRYLGDREEPIEEVLKAYAFSLFWETWVDQVEEFEDSYDLDQERERAEETFFTLYDQSNY
ncbi:MAG TPA: hypothetical protein VKA68_19320 [bacterium]|nr:hypothetical protein [bacterium]